MSPSAFLWCTPNSEPARPSGGCQTPGRGTPFEQPIRPPPHPLPLSPPPFKPSSRRPAPVRAQGGSRCLGSHPAGSGARNPLGAAERAAAPARPWAGVFDRQWLRQQRLADQEGEKQGGRGRRRGAWGPPPSPLCLPETPARRSPSPSLLSPVSEDPRSPSSPHPNPGNRTPPNSRAPRRGGWRAGARSRGWGAQARDHCPSRPTLTLRAGGLRRRLAGSPGGAAEQQPQQRQQPREDAGATLRRHRGARPGPNGPWLPPGPTRPAPLSPSSAPRRAARAPARVPALAAAAAQCDCLRQEPPPAPPAGDAPPRGTPGTAPSLSTAHPEAPAACPEPQLLGSVANRVQSQGFSEFLSPGNLLQNFERENDCCLQHKGLVISVSLNCKNYPVLSAQTPAQCWGGRAQPPWESPSLGSRLASASS